MAWMELFNTSPTAEQLEKDARAKRREAKSLKRKASQLRAEERSAGRKRSYRTDFQPEKPYDRGESGAVKYPMYFIKHSQEYLFGLRLWTNSQKGGHPWHRVTLPVTLIDDVVLGLASVCGKFAATEGLPSELRCKLKSYRQFLTAAHKEVQSELAGQVGPRPNGGEPTSDK